MAECQFPKTSKISHKNILVKKHEDLQWFCVISFLCAALFFFFFKEKQQW